MSNDFIIFAPLPQLKVSTKLSSYNLGKDFSIRPFEPELRRKLLDKAKQKECSDNFLMLLNESETIFCAKLPRLDKKKDEYPLDGLIYTVITEEIVKKIFKCLLLFVWVPDPLMINCWFFASGSFDDVNIDSLQMLDPKWEYINLFTNIDWRSGDVEPEDITLGLIGLQKYWDKILGFCQIDQLKKIATDKKKVDGIWASARKSVEKGKLEELIKAKYGSDSTLDDGEDNTNINSEIDDNDLPTLKISTPMYFRWFMPELAKSYQREINKLSHELNKRVIPERLDRSFQFFVEAFRLPEPYKFVAFATCMETLFCTGRSEITFQLASRIAWFLHPTDYKKRIETFARVKKIYGIRSDIVHGTNYSSSKIDIAEGELISLTMKSFYKVFDNDNIYNLFRHKNQELCNKYLEELNFGQAD